MRAACSVVLLIGSAITHAQGRLVGHGNLRRYVSDKYAFSVSFPRGWSVYLKDNTPLYLHIPPDRVDEFNRGQGKLPAGGALISFIPEDRGPYPNLGPALADWAKRDAKVSCECEPTIQAFHMPPATEIADAILVSFDEKAYAIGEKPEHDLNIYFNFEGRRFDANLEYPAGDALASEDEKVFLKVVRSLRPIHKP